ncbi:MAG: ABC transporter permease [Actinomycetota bacterium]|uniref:ABC transporter permease n=1 Tax=Euzebya pacifica TaxID=1608957 RepID=UPI0030FADC93
MEGDVGPWGVVASLVLVAVAAAASWRFRLGLVRPLLESAVLACVQLLVVGAALLLVIRPEQPLWWSWLWVVAMIGYAAWTVRQRVPTAPAVLSAALVSFGVTALVALAVLFGLQVFPVEGRTVVPLAGMAVGNSMTAAVVAARMLVERFTDQRGQVEASLALGMSPPQAVLPLVRVVLREALSPQIERTRTVGLVFLPGAMVGLILAGVDPLDAVLVQVVVMYLVLGAVAASATTITIVLSRRLFTADWRPRVLS